MSNDRCCSPDPEAIHMTVKNNLLSALHSWIDGTARIEVVQPSHLLGVYLNNSSPFGALSLGILKLSSPSITILCFCLGFVFTNGACLCSGQFPFHCWVWFPAYFKDNWLVPDPPEWLQLWRHCSPGEPATCFSPAIPRHSRFLPSCLHCKQLQLARSPSSMFMGLVSEEALQSQTLFSAISCLQLSPVP